MFTEELERLRKDCETFGVPVDLGTEEDFYWFCFAAFAVCGLALADQKDILLRLAGGRAPEKARRSAARLGTYVLDRFPRPEVRRAVEILAEVNLPEAFTRCSLEEAEALLEKIDRSNRDADAARFVFRANGVPVAFPEGFIEEEFRAYYETCLRRHALRKCRAYTESRLRDAEMLVTGRVAEIRSLEKERARLEKKLARASEALKSKAREAREHRRAAAEALRRSEEMELFYRSQLEELRRSLERLSRENEALRRENSALREQLALRGASPGPLAGRRVLVAGDPRRREAYRESLAGSFGAEVVFVDAAEPDSGYLDLLKSADLAVITAAYGRHKITAPLREEARKLGIPVLTASSSGAGSVLAAVRGYLAAREKERGPAFGIPSTN